MTPEFAQKFKKMCKDDLGLELTDAEAWDHASAMLEMFRAIYRPLPSQMKKGENKATDANHLPTD